MDTLNEMLNQPLTLSGLVPEDTCALEPKYEGRAYSSYLTSQLVRGSWCEVHQHWFFTKLDKGDRELMREAASTSSAELFGDSHGL